jgi:hypothetical protein
MKMIVNVRFEVFRALWVWIWRRVTFFGSASQIPRWGGCCENCDNWVALCTSHFIFHDHKHDHNTAHACNKVYALKIARNTILRPTVKRQDASYQRVNSPGLANIVTVPPHLKPTLHLASSNCACALITLNEPANNACDWLSVAG